MIQVWLTRLSLQSQCKVLLWLFGRGHDNRCVMETCSCGFLSRNTWHSRGQTVILVACGAPLFLVLISLVSCWTWVLKILSLNILFPLFLAWLWETFSKGSLLKIHIGEVQLLIFRHPVETGKGFTEICHFSLS